MHGGYGGAYVRVCLNTCNAEYIGSFTVLCAM